MGSLVSSMFESKTPPPPPPAPKIEEEAEASETPEEARKRRLRAGRAQLIETSTRGVLNPANTGRKRLTS